MDFRNTNIGVAVGAIVLIMGAVLFQGNDDAYAATTVASLVIAIAVSIALDIRDERAGRKDSRRSS
jgi:uncharacterized membrane protein